MLEIDSLFEAAMALPKENVKTPHYPVDVYIQEAEDLYQWCKDDKSALLAVGLDEKTLEEIPSLTVALSKAHSQWTNAYKSSLAKGKTWKDRKHAAGELQKQLFHAFNYAFRADNGLLAVLPALKKGTGYAGLIQNLNDLSVLGKTHKSLLSAIHFDLELLDKAARESEELAKVWSALKHERDSDFQEKEYRNRVYTLLKTRVDAVRMCGKYVFHGNPHRLAGYSSAYLKQKNSRNSGRKRKTDTP